MKNVVVTIIFVMIAVTYSSAQQKIKFKIPRADNNGASVDYDGAVVNGRANGYGKGVLENGNNYEGNWVDNQMQGKGKLVFKNGDIYEGNLDKGVLTGKGVMVYASSGDKYDGDWINGKRTGKCIFTFKDGKKYIGDVVEGKWQGKGSFYYKDSSVYTGDWVNSAWNGKCVYDFGDGRTYIGDAKNDQWEGKGMFIDSLSYKYEGDFKNSSFDGNGIYTGNNGYKYVGEYKNNKSMGYAKYLLVNGSYGEGIIDSTKGYMVTGKLYNKNGDIYEGSFNKLNGNYEGFGKIAYTNGTTSQGKFNNGYLELVLTKEEYEKKYNTKVETVVLPDWIKNTNIIDTTIYTSKQYLLPAVNKYIDYNDAQKEFLFTLQGTAKPAKAMRIYNLDNTQKQIFFDVTGHYVYTLVFRVDGAFVTSYRDDGKTNEVSSAFYLFKIPKAKPQEWKVTFENTDYRFKSENTTLKIGAAVTPAILVTQTKLADKTYNRKFYYVKNKGLYKVEQNGKLLAILK